MNELRTRDLDGATRFYGEVFGWEIEPLEQGGEVMYGSVRLGGQAPTEPMAVPQGRFLALADPQGAAFMILEGQYDPPPGS